MVRKSLTALTAALFSTVLISCTNDKGELGNTDVTALFPNDPSKTVCTPFNNGDPALSKNGLLASLNYLSDDQPRYSNLADFMANAHPVDVNLFMNRLDIPTRPFDQGFTTQSGTLVTNQNGTTLYEYFGVRMDSILQLRDSDPEGDYQIALFADDGANLWLDEGSGLNLLVNDDGTHPTEMGCAIHTVHMTHESRMPMHVDYYQGPRYHIALVMAWRLAPADGSKDPMCGQYGNSLYWDSTQTPSAPTGWTNLVSRGWSELATENFLLPDNNIQNPCAQQGPVTISNFNVTGVTNNSATLVWTTNVPADSTVNYQVNDGTNSQPILSVNDSTQVTSHSVTITGLSAFTLYNVQVGSSNGGTPVTNAWSTFRTLR